MPECLQMVKVVHVMFCVFCHNKKENTLFKEIEHQRISECRSGQPAPPVTPQQGSSPGALGMGPPCRPPTSEPPPPEVSGACRRRGAPWAQGHLPISGPFTPQNITYVGPLSRRRHVSHHD